MGYCLRTFQNEMQPFSRQVAMRTPEVWGRGGESTAHNDIIFVAVARPVMEEATAMKMMSSSTLEGACLQRFWYVINHSLHITVPVKQMRHAENKELDVYNPLVTATSRDGYIKMFATIF